MQNGDVFVFTGMLNTVVDVHQLAVIIGHEMAHAVLGHSVSASLSTGLCCVFCATISRLRQRLGATRHENVFRLDACSKRSLVGAGMCHIVREQIDLKAFIYLFFLRAAGVSASHRAVIYI